MNIKAVEFRGIGIKSVTRIVKNIISYFFPGEMFR